MAALAEDIHDGSLPDGREGSPSKHQDGGCGTRRPWPIPLDDAAVRQAMDIECGSGGSSPRCEHRQLAPGDPS
jgi:hypothetical protein